jgi:alkylated DNA nucleotide flippase Atl1
MKMNGDAIIDIEHKHSTTDLLRKALARLFKVQGTCPVTTKKALQSIAQDSGPSIAYWRVVKANGELNTIFPGGSAGQAARLRKEGFTIEIKRNVMKVRDFRARLVRID